jgi:hypothetical protein
MPTLRPQVLSGLVVIPTVEHVPGIWRVSIAIDVGMSRALPADVVNREDLVVELRNPAEGSFEPIASPDPGPLPARAIRVVQARGEYTFAQGVNSPTELKVTLRGDQKLFPMSQTLAPTGCLKREPKEGGPFAASPVRNGGIVSLVQRYFPPLKPRCCPGHFNVPVSSSTDPAAKSEYFEMAADFSARARFCRCTCCEYRQFVRGTFTDANSVSVPFDMPSGPLDPVRYCEDGAIDEFGPGRHGYYGHRDTSTAGDEYSGKGGCTYRGNETASCQPGDTMHLEFIGLVIDRCRGTVAAKRTWAIDL